MATEHGQKTTTPGYHVDSTLTERAKKNEPERSVHHRLHLVLSGTSMMTKCHESAMSSVMGGGLPARRVLAHLWVSISDHCP